MKKITLLLVAALILGQVANAQAPKDAISENEKTKADAAKAEDGWKKTASLGLNLDQLALINPRPGDGVNKLGLGANGVISATYKKGRLYWTNGASETFGLQRLGRGNSVPFQKSADELKAWSGIGYQAKENSKWFYMLDGRLRTQLTPSYLGTGTIGNLVKFSPEYNLGISDSSFNALSDSAQSVQRNSRLQSKFLAPGYVTIAPGMSYVHNEHFDFFFSPAAVNLIIVNDDFIASRVNPGDSTRSLYGTKWRSASDFDKVELQLGAMARARYKNKFLNDKVTFASELILYSNYLFNPQNVDVEWNNDLGFVIAKGLTLNLKASAYYDDDQVVTVDRDEDITTGPNGHEGFGKRVRVVQGLFITYTKSF